MGREIWPDRRIIVVLLMVSFFGLQGCKVNPVELKVLNDGTFQQPSSDDATADVIHAPELNGYSGLSTSFTNYFLLESLSQPIAPQGQNLQNTTFTISPSLPVGLQMDESTGAISGTPVSNLSPTNFTITASNSEGSASVQLQLAFLPGFRVNRSADSADDDGGADTDCFSTTANGCTLRAAIETTNMMGGKQLIVLDSDVVIDSSMTILDDLVIVKGTHNAVTPSTDNTYRWIEHSASGKSLTLIGLQVSRFGSTSFDGGVILANGTVNLNVFNSHFMGNQAYRAAVFYLRGGSKTLIKNSEFYGNLGSNTGGVFDARDSGTEVILENSYGEGNQAGWGSIAHICDSSVSSVRNSTFYNNVNTTHGLFAVCVGEYIFENMTAVNNSSTSSTGAPLIYMHQNSSKVTISNSIFSNNLDGNGDDVACFINGAATPDLQSLGGNIFTGSESGCTSYLNLASDQLSTDPLLEDGPGKNNGGPVKTILPTAFSPAVDSGESGSCLATDARGLARFINFLGGGALCDAGAVELQIE